MRFFIGKTTIEEASSRVKVPISFQFDPLTGEVEVECKEAGVSSAGYPVYAQNGARFGWAYAGADFKNFPRGWLLSADDPYIAKG